MEKILNGLDLLWNWTEMYKMSALGFIKEQPGGSGEREEPSLCALTLNKVSKLLDQTQK